MEVSAAILLLCYVASACAGPEDAASPGGADPDPSMPCLHGAPDCRPPWSVCPGGMRPGPLCALVIPGCRPGYICIRGRCCKPNIIPPPRCPPGTLTGPLCGPSRPCKYGYTCRRGRCCSNRCPAGMLQGPFCNHAAPCKPGYACMKGVCCRRRDPPPRCPFHHIRIPGRCDGGRRCEPGALCYRGGICCVPKPTIPRTGSLSPV